MLENESSFENESCFLHWVTLQTQGQKSFNLPKKLGPSGALTIFGL